MRVFADLRRMPRWEGIVLAAAAAAIGGWWVGSWFGGPRTGAIALTVAPADATVLIDDIAMRGPSPLTIDKPQGPYTVSVTRDGYQRRDQVVEVRSGHVTTLKVSLEASADTGFELTSEPQGQPVWLDGVPVRLATGAQARTDFRATRIAPGRHVIEIAGDGFLRWREEIEVEPAMFRKIHATLLPRQALAPR